MANNYTRINPTLHHHRKLRSISVTIWTNRIKAGAGGVMERRLYRSQRNRVLLGVCGGLGEYLNIDPVIIRIIVVLLTLATGGIPGILAYIIVALIVPVEGSSATSPQESVRENVDDLKRTTSALEQDIRATFGNKEVRKDSSQDSSPESPVSPPSRPAYNFLLILGIIIIGIGVLVILNNFFGFLFWRIFWPALLIAAGLIIILAVLNRQKSG